MPRPTRLRVGVLTWPTAMLTSDANPERAPVRPRVLRADSMLPRLLEEEVAELLAAGLTTNMFLAGRSGLGKSTALAHLAAVFANADEQRLTEEQLTIRVGTATVTVSTSHRHTLRFELQPWSDDDVIEYLLATHTKDAARVLKAFQAGAPHDLLEWPGACRRVLDMLATHEQLQTARAGMAAALALALGDDYTQAAAWALDSDQNTSQQLASQRLCPAPLHRFRHLLGSTTARSMLKADWLLAIAAQQPHYRTAPVAWHEQLRFAIAHTLHADPARHAELIAISLQPRLRHKALVMSALCLHEPDYCPKHRVHGELRLAWLQGIVLRDQHIRANLSSSNLANADLRGAQFERCQLTYANLRGAQAERTQFLTLRATSLRAHALDAPQSSWPRAQLAYSEFHGANLEGAKLPGADLRGSNFAAACLKDADLTDTNLSNAQLADCNLEDARLNRTHLVRVDLRSTRLDGVQLTNARVARCNFEGTLIARLSAGATQFFDCDLSGVAWRNSELRCASFAQCGLADVDWEGADLRCADFRYATFHLGNSRSGLIDSTIAGEGSRTGYYTDESLEERFQAPEDVRKANLRHCDLRGATIIGVDFYLVDLRGAKLDPEQRDWLLRCRAILDPIALAIDG